MSKILAGLAISLSTTAAVAAYHHVKPRQVARAMATWHPASVRSGGIAEISATQPDSAGGRGSLELTLAEAYGPEGLGEFQVFSRDVVLSARGGLRAKHRGFGRVADLKELSFEWYRDGGSSVLGLFTPALRVYVFDPDAGTDGATSVFIWEGVYNGYATSAPLAVPVDQWIHSNVTEDHFWRVPLFADGAPVPRSFCGDNPSECFVFNRTLSEWPVGPHAVVIGLSIAVGSGWAGSFKGYADLVHLEFTSGATYTWDFEPCRHRRWCRSSRTMKHDILRDASSTTPFRLR